jgi:hypothetical protein
LLRICAAGESLNQTSSESSARQFLARLRRRAAVLLFFFRHSFLLLGRGSVAWADHIDFGGAALPSGSDRYIR